MVRDSLGKCDPRSLHKVGDQVYHLPLDVEWDAVEVGFWVQPDAECSPCMVIRTEPLVHGRTWAIFADGGGRECDSNDTVTVVANTPDLAEQVKITWPATEDQDWNFSSVFPEGLPWFNSGSPWQPEPQSKPKPKLDAVAFVATARSLKRLLAHRDVVDSSLSVLEVPQIQDSIKKEWRNLKRIMERAGLDD